MAERIAIIAPTEASRLNLAKVIHATAEGHSVQRLGAKEKSSSIDPLVLTYKSQFNDRGCKYEYVSFSLDNPTALKACDLKFETMLVPKDFDTKLLDEFCNFREVRETSWMRVWEVDFGDDGSLAQTAMSLKPRAVTPPGMGSGSW